MSPFRNVGGVISSESRLKARGWMLRDYAQASYHKIEGKEAVLFGGKVDASKLNLYHNFGINEKREVVQPLDDDAVTDLALKVTIRKGDVYTYHRFGGMRCIRGCRQCCLQSLVQYGRVDEQIIQEVRQHHQRRVINLIPQPQACR